LLIASLLLIIGLITQQLPLILVSILFILVRGVTGLWGRYCLSRIEYQRRLSSNRVFFGDEVVFEVEVANRKPLPLPWIQIDDMVSSEVSFLKGKTTPSPDTTGVFLSNFFSLGWYHKVKRRYPMHCLQRGYFAFGPSRIRSGDIFGFFSREMEVKQMDYLMVYPKIVSLEKLGILSKQPLGDIRTRRHIFEDPVLTSGIRDYNSGDSLKRIHWKSTARLGKLQVKVFEPTTITDMGIFLDVRTIKPALGGGVPELLELAILTTAAIANRAMTDGYRVGLYVNQHKRFVDEPIRVPPSQHTDQMRLILEALAYTHSYETMPITRLVQRESRNLPWGSTVVVISAMPESAILSALVEMKRTGRSVVLIVIGGPEPSINKESLTVYHIPEEVAWRELEMISMTG
ncbi:MAG: DUF58 domain-containing protein, partial [Dehalococcoidales bacterium]|nr:DUF58 domain-containing protein [Dehalococcoidales bacterium]